MIGTCYFGSRAYLSSLSTGLRVSRGARETGSAESRDEVRVVCNELRVPAHKAHPLRTLPPVLEAECQPAAVGHRPRHRLRGLGLRRAPRSPHWTTSYHWIALFTQLTSARYCILYTFACLQYVRGCKPKRFAPILVFSRQGEGVFSPDVEGLMCSEGGQYSRADILV